RVRLVLGAGAGTVGGRLPGVGGSLRGLGVRGGRLALPAAHLTRLGVDEPPVPDDGPRPGALLVGSAPGLGSADVGHLFSSSSPTSASATSSSDALFGSTSAAPVASAKPAPAPAPAPSALCAAYMAEPIFWLSVERVSILALMSSIEAPES